MIMIQIYVQIYVQFSLENTHKDTIPAINPSQYGPFLVNLTHFLPKLGQPLRWPYFVAGFLLAKWEQ